MSESERKPLISSSGDSAGYSSITHEPLPSSKLSNGNYQQNGVYQQQSTVSFHNLFYEIQVGAGCCKKTPQDIIRDVSGLFKPGTMNAIMGPTGSGKTSLLDILAARKDPNGLSGSVLINGHPQPANFRLMSGYVVQDDVVMGTLSIKENLKFSADLRLPDHYSKEEKEERLNRVIAELGLEQCENTRVGDEFTRGVSGGERKRCNVGMEMIIAPGVLFLDEPTTGLDASTANSVMQNLKRLAEKGSTVIFSIHQPRYSIFKLFDSLCLLGNGYTIYHGPANQAIDFFQSLGYHIEEHDNPADFFLDVILGNIEPITSELPPSSQKQNGTQTAVEVEDTEITEKMRARSELLSLQFKQSAWGQQLEQELEPLNQQLEASGKHMPDPQLMSKLQYVTSPCKQFFVVCGRAIKNLVRNPRTSYLQVVTMIFFALVTGVIYINSPKDCISGVQNRVGAFFFMIMNQIFGNLSAIDLFIKERKIFIHENVSGFYRVSSYFFAKLICDVIPNRTVPVIIFSVIVYWMIGLVAKATSFFFFILTLVITSLAGASVGFVASATTRTPAIANLITALIYVFQMIFSGLLINLDSLGDWIRWAKYISIFSYAMQALQVNEFTEVDFYLDQQIPGTNRTVPVNCVKGNKHAWLEKQGIPYKTDWDRWVNIMALGAITVGLLFISYIQLRRIKKLK